MFKLLTWCVLGAVALLAVGVSGCLVCPQAVPEDTSTVFCAKNENYGYWNVTDSQFANWNCNQWLNTYECYSDEPCPPNPDTLATCGVNMCTRKGDAPLCAKLASGNTVAVFANECQLKYYNCRFPKHQYTQSPLYGLFGLCRSIGLGI